MARNTTITDGQILEAARTIFLRDGFNAPTSRIANIAQVSEGSIFKRFGTKEALFFAALEIPILPTWHAEIEVLIKSSNHDVESSLINLCTSILSHFHLIMPRIITAIGSRISPPFDLDAEHGSPLEPPPVRDVRIISRYLEHEIAAGRLARIDTERLAGILLGTLINHAFSVFASGRKPDVTESYKVAQGTVEILWRGIEPRK